MDISNLDYSTTLNLDTRSRQSPGRTLKGGFGLNSLFFLMGQTDEPDLPGIPPAFDGLPDFSDPSPSPNTSRTYTLGGLEITETSASKGGVTSRSVVGSGVVGGQSVVFASSSASSRW